MIIIVCYLHIFRLKVHELLLSPFLSKSKDVAEFVLEVVGRHREHMYIIPCMSNCNTLIRLLFYKLHNTFSQTPVGADLDISWWAQMLLMGPEGNLKVSLLGCKPT